VIRVRIRLPAPLALSALRQDRKIAGFRNVLRTVERIAREDAPKRTGALRRSIHAVHVHPLEGSLFIFAPHARYLLHGTGLYGRFKKPFVIRPRRRKYLWWPGALHPVKMVRQKGIKPRNFLRRALSEQTIRAAFEEEARNSP
jgi:hypothetical protein